MADTLMFAIGSKIMEIETSHGTILADDADRELLEGLSWYAVKVYGNRFYAHARLSGTGKRVLMHRLLMSARPGIVVHHINNNGLDNRRANLELTTHRQNLRYHHFQRDDAGVHFYKQTGKWRAQRRGQDGKLVSLGMYATKDEAIAASLAFREELQ